MIRLLLQVEKMEQEGLEGVLIQVEVAGDVKEVEEGQMVEVLVVVLRATTLP